MIDKMPEIYIFLPFLFVLLCLVCFVFKKNNLCEIFSKIYALINVLAAGVFLFFRFNIEAIFLFTSAVIIFCIVFIFKNYIQKLRAFFAAAVIFLSGLLNIFILSNNIFLNLSAIFLFFIICYILNNSYLLQKNEKEKIKFQLFYDLVIYFISAFLICFNFLYYFIDNKIEFNFLNISQNIPFIDNFSIICALLGFLILGFRLQNCIFISFKSVKNLSFINNLVSLFLLTASSVFGIVLLFKTFNSFYLIILKYQNLIISYLIFNFIYLVFLSIKENSILKILSYNLSSYLTLAFLILLSFNDNSKNIFIYYFNVLIFSYFLASLVGNLLDEKLKIKNIFEFKKLKNEDKAIKTLVLYSFLNILNIPFLGLFVPFLFGLTEIIKAQNILSYSFFIIIFSYFISICSIYNLLNKILIEPVEYKKEKITLNKIEGFIFIVLILIIILSGFYLVFKEGALCLV